MSKNNWVPARPNEAGLTKAMAQPDLQKSKVDCKRVGFTKIAHLHPADVQ
jgi:hypothetical protein